MVRVRFAPSPTGLLHVGNVRTALFNWLFARKENGVFILRIEDTDIERSDPAYEKQLLQDLRWLGLHWDEGIEIGGHYGPYRQTDRYEIYRSFANRLVEEGKSYYCFCSEEELEQERQVQLAHGQTPKYSGKCRGIAQDVAINRLRTGGKAVVRLRVREGTVGFNDIVFGEIRVDCATIGDPILLRSDGSPNYNFSCVVDDQLMKISHVIRGEGHISNTHRQVLIYEALETIPPRFAHLSTVLGNDGAKLSKRHGATSVDEFRNQGYLPEALVNYLTLLGWSPAEEGQEIMPVSEIVKQFTLERVNKSPAIFDTDKLNWINRHYIKAMDRQQLLDATKDYFIAAGVLPEHINDDIAQWLALVLDAIRGHLDHLDQVVEKSKIIFEFHPENIPASPGTSEILTSEPAKVVVKAFYEETKQSSLTAADQYKAAVARVKGKTGQKGKNLFHPLRIALTASGAGPDLDKLVPIYELGSNLSLPRKIKGCRERLEEVIKMF